MRNIPYNGNMRHEQALERLPGALSGALETPVQGMLALPVGNYEPDAELFARGKTFVVEYKSAASADLVGSALAMLQRVAEARPDVVPLLVVPFMGEVGKRLCRDEEVSWLDLSGNANISAPGLCIRIEGRPNAYARSGRPRDLFAPTYSRLARALLLQPAHEFTAAELADVTDMHRGTLSKLLPRYAEAGFVNAKGRGRGARWSVTDPDLLLDAWDAAYDFGAHTIRRGHVPASAGERLTRDLARRFDGAGVAYAATGLAAAWLLEPFATYRLVTMYAPAWPPDDLLESIGFVGEPRGANLWLVQPNDEGVLLGGGVTGEVSHVSAVQVYLDLKAQPERSKEAAEELGRRLRREWSRGSDT